MNSVHLIGRITKKPELLTNTKGNNYCRITVAINRPKKEDGTQEADFISCVAWKKTAELICQYFNKGSLIGLDGSIQTGSYDKEDGTKVYTTDVLVYRVYFSEKKGDSRPEPQEPNEFKESKEENDPFADFGEAVELDDTFLD